MSTRPLRHRLVFRRGWGEKRPARGAPQRHHAGIDIRAQRNEPVYSPEPGNVARVINWTSTNKAIVLHADNGSTVILAAVKPTVKAGERVKEGQQVGRIAPYPKGSTMLHLELYSRHVSANKRWPWGAPAPAWLVDPYDYLTKLNQSRTPRKRKSSRVGLGGAVGGAAAAYLLLKALK